MVILERDINGFLFQMGVHASIFQGILLVNYISRLGEDPDKSSVYCVDMSVCCAWRLGESANLHSKVIIRPSCC